MEKQGQHRRFLVVLAAAVALAAVAAYAWRRDAGAAPQYVTVPAARGSVAQAVVASGTVNPVTTVQVGSYVSGVVQSVLCDFNTQVKAGQLCAKIDPRPYQSAVEQAAAALAMARAQLDKDRANVDYARQAHQRDVALQRRGFVPGATTDASRNAYDQARAQLAVDRASLVQREAQWQAARINLGYTDIVSPVSGTVVSRNITQGQTVAASFQTPTLFLIATDLTRMQVDTNVSESDIGRISAGDPASFTVSSFPDRQFAGHVRQVRQAPQTVQNVVTYDVVVDVPNPDMALKPGMTASVRIVTERADNVLRVPGQALRYRPTANGEASNGGEAGAQRRARSGDAGAGGGGPARVWVLDGGRPRPVPVKVGLDGDSYVEIAGGDLREGDAVIVAEKGGATREQRPRTPPGMMPMRR